MFTGSLKRADIYPEKSCRAVVALTCAAIFISSLESSAVASILPEITRYFGNDFQNTKWVISMYLLTIISLLLIAGRLGDMFGCRRFFLIGLVITFFGALSCEASRSIPILCTARVIEACGIVLIVSNGTALLTRHSDTNRRGLNLGLLSSAAYAGLVAGTSLSGWLTSFFGWQSVFIIVAFFSAIVFLAGMVYLPEEPVTGGKDYLDITGPVLLTFGLAAIVWSLNEAGSKNWHWVSNWELLLAGIFIIILAISRKQFYLIRDLFNPLVTAASLAAMLIYTGTYCLTFALPFYISGNHLATLTSMGLLLAVRPWATVLVAPFGGLLADRLGKRALLLIGLVVLFIAFFLGLFLDISNRILSLVIPLGFAGMGMGLFLPANHKLIMESVPSGNRGTASAMIALTRNIGMLLGVTLGAFFFNISRGHRQNLAAPVHVPIHSVFYSAAVSAGAALLIIASCYKKMPANRSTGALLP